MTTGRRMLALALVLAGCVPPRSFHGVDVSTGEVIELRPSAVAAGASLSGHYRSAQLGELSIEQTGTALAGRYEQHYADCDVRGVLLGKISGNLAEISWAERHANCPGARDLRGKGYLFHVPGQEPKLFGRRLTRVLVQARLPGRERAVMRDIGPFTATKL
jgi:hypothetical protein